MSARFLVGDSLTVLRTLPDASVDLVLTSPPFLALRSYLPPDHPDKAHEMGSEATPGEFLDALLDVIEECERVLAPHGSIAIELGDTYAGCVDESTEALTADGWKRYDELTSGDRILTLHPESRLAEWGTVERVNVYAPARRNCLLVEGRGHSSLTTADHRWYVERRTTDNGNGCARPSEQNGMASLTLAEVEQIRHRYEPGVTRQADLARDFGVTQTAISKSVTGRTWTQAPVMATRDRERVKDVRRSSELRTEDSIPIAAPIVNLPTEQKWSDAFVEAIAWYWTEGHDRKPGVGRSALTGVYIGQSNRVNPHNCERIRRCLTALFGPPSRRLPGVKNAGPTWIERIWPSEPDKTEWRLNAAAARVLREAAPDRVPQVSWLTTLTQAQLDLFIEASIAADEHDDGAGEVALGQKEPRRAEAFQIACVLAGKAASLSRGPAKPGHAYAMTVVQVRNNTRIKPLRHPHRWIQYDGMVWCPTTNNGSWLARRNGQVFFTGNSGGAGGDYTDTGLRAGQEKFNGSAIQHRRTAQRNRGNGGADRGWPLEKSLCLIPEIFRFALVYGFNPLTGRETPRWRARNVVRWVRPNPPVGALADKFRPATSELVIACKSRKRYFDLDAVREPLSAKTNGNLKAPNSVAQTTARSGNKDNADVPPSIAYGVNPAAGAPPLDWWVIPPGGYSGAHYAVFPEALCVRPIKAMCPERVCTICGQPSERIVDIGYVDANGKPATGENWSSGVADGKGAHSLKKATRTTTTTTTTTTTGWTDCGHGSYRNGVTLDPFAGSGTTLAVATGHGRDALGVDLDERNAELARQRVGMWLEVEYHGKAGAA